METTSRRRAAAQANDRTPESSGNGDRALLRVRGLSKTYREGDTERAIFDGLDLSVPRGAFTVLMGRSGAGKSTLLNLISGIDRPDAGTVSVGDTELTALSEKERTQFRRRHVGFIFQAFNLIPTLTALENILLPLELGGGAGQEETERARALLEKVNLADRADSFPDRLSGGEQQRVAVARALAHRPRLVLADEPTGNLDASTAEQVLDVLAELASESDTTLLVATHDQTVLPRANRVLDLEDGRLVERGSGRERMGENASEASAPVERAASEVQGAEAPASKEASA